MWATTYGTNKLAEQCGVSAWSVRQWKAGLAAPRPERILKIVELSKGELTTDEVLRETSRNR